MDRNMDETRGRGLDGQDGVAGSEFTYRLLTALLLNSIKSNDFN